MRNREGLRLKIRLMCALGRSVVQQQDGIVSIERLFSSRKPPSKDHLARRMGTGGIMLSKYTLSIAAATMLQSCCNHAATTMQACSESSRATMGLAANIS